MFLLRCRRWLLLLLWLEACIGHGLALGFLSGDKNLGVPVCAQVRRISHFLRGLKALLLPLLTDLRFGWSLG